MTKKVLLAGESWMSYTTHVKGFDSFFTSKYETGEKWIKDALNSGGYEVDFIPNHLADNNFPFTFDEINQYCCVILSDIGSNTLLLPSDTFAKSISKPNRCDLIRDYVLCGGALLMIGGYMTFSGIDGKGRWGTTAVQEVLPVKILRSDDREEHPEGVVPTVVRQHEALKYIQGDWPAFLGYNKTEALPEAFLSVTINNDPFLAFLECGDGRSAAFTSDCAPHWGPLEFVNWKYYSALWNGIMKWLTKGT